MGEEEGGSEGRRGRGRVVREREREREMTRRRGCATTDGEERLRERGEDGGTYELIPMRSFVAVTLPKSDFYDN